MRVRPSAAYASFDVDDRPGGGTSSDGATSPHTLVNQPRWLLRLDAGELRLVDGEAELAELFRLGRVTSATPVYEISSGPRPLGDLPGMARVLLSPGESAPPVRGGHRSPERDLLSEELAILDRPLEIEYEDERPARRRPRRAALVIALAAVVIAASPMLAPRVPAWRARLRGLVHRAFPARTVADAAPRPLPPPPAPAAALGPRQDAVPLAAPATLVVSAPTAPTEGEEARAVAAASDLKVEAAHATKEHHSHHSSRHHRR